jgi:hypothetical protein
MGLVFTLVHLLFTMVSKFSRYGPVLVSRLLCSFQLVGAPGGSDLGATYLCTTALVVLGADTLLEDPAPWPQGKYFGKRLPCASLEIIAVGMTEGRGESETGCILRTWKCVKRVLIRVTLTLEDPTPVAQGRNTLEKTCASLETLSQSVDEGRGESESRHIVLRTWPQRPQPVMLGHTRICFVDVILIGM